MTKREYQYAELQVDNSLLEKFSQEMSAYYQDESAELKRDFYASFKRKLIWHINNSLSPRQKQSLLLILSGRTEREAAAAMRISQQVVHIYKVRAINKLRERFFA